MSVNRHRIPPGHGIGRFTIKPKPHTSPRSSVYARDSNGTDGGCSRIVWTTQKSPEADDRERRQHQQLAGPGLTACSSPPPAPPRQPVGVETTVSTGYYPVRGTTTAAIFAAIDANGLVETSGQREVGVPSAEWKLTSGDVDVRAVPCVFPSLTVILHLVVKLPRHETPDDLPADLRDRWERFVARVAAHEQRHVDIYLEGAKAMKARLEATRTAVSCADLEKAIDAEWRAQQADIERAQAGVPAPGRNTAPRAREAGHAPRHRPPRPAAAPDAQ